MDFRRLHVPRNGVSRNEAGAGRRLPRLEASGASAARRHDFLYDGFLR